MTGERGAVLVLSLVVAASLAVVGMAFVLIGETESRVARNERLGSQALYFGESAARQARRWFDAPDPGREHLGYPGNAEVDRTSRIIDLDGDGPASPVPADGTLARPYYKQGIDLDEDGRDDLFRSPYRDDPRHAFLGTEDGPDIRIDRDASSAATAFLDALSSRIGGGSLGARIDRIDVFGAPAIPTVSGFRRAGIATVRIAVGVYPGPPRARGPFARRVVEMVLDEIPYRSPFGALHACGGMTADRTPRARWGAVGVAGPASLSADHTETAASLARAEPLVPSIDRLSFDDDADGARFAEYLAAIEGMPVDDPWLRILSAGPASPRLCAGWQPAVQPCPFDWEGGPIGDGQLPHHPEGPGDGTHSNVFQNVIDLDCPGYDFALFRRIARSGRHATRYFAWDVGTRFREGGRGPSREFREITDNAEGFFFFDTKDGAPPTDTDGDGEPDNLTPTIRIVGGAWGVTGFVYLNSESFGLDVGAGRPVELRAPGEPYRDANRDGRYDPGEDWVNLSYPATLGGVFRVDAWDALGGGVLRNATGPRISADASVRGVLYVSGDFDLSGRGRVFGSVVAGRNFVEDDSVHESVEVFRDHRLDDDWPPSGWDVPRVFVRVWRAGPAKLGSP